LNRSLRATAGLAALVCILPGCSSSSETGGTTDPEKQVQAGPNSRIKFKEEYKKMIGKDGKLLQKPSDYTKRPPGIPR
jgi:hypothetical protein